MPSILLTNYYTKPLLDIVHSVIPSSFEVISIDEASKECIIKKASGADYFIVGGRIKIDRDIINAAPQLKMIQRTGVGLDSLDIQLLKEKNIPIYVNEGINSQSVAEHAVMLILSVTKNLTNINTLLKSGIWKKHESGIRNFELKNKTIGLIGLGNIGILVSKMLRPFGINIIYYKRNRLYEKDEKNLGITYKTFQEVLEMSDIVSLHCPFTRETRKMIGAVQLSLMKKGSFIINTSRGKLIDEKALIENLKSGHIRGAGLDVYEQEPIPKENELLTLDNVILTPHISGITYESYKSMIQGAFNNIELFEQGKLDYIESKKIVY